MKKGFTLIEFLSVIVVLGIIFLIAFPVLINIIEKVRESAFKSSLSMAFSQAEISLFDSSTSTESVDISTLKLKNNNFKYGMIKQNISGKLEIVNASDGKYCGNGTIDNLVAYKGECDNSIPSSPIVEVDSEIFSSSKIYLVTPPDTISGILRYEYYTSDTSEIPSDTVTPIAVSTDNTIVVSEDSKYIFFRVVNKALKNGSWSSALINYVDNTRPVIKNISINKNIITFDIEDKSLTGYGCNQSSTEEPNWIANESGENITCKLDSIGTYYAWAKDLAGNKRSLEFEISSGAFCPYNLGQVWNFTYTGGSQSFNIPEGCAGKYKLEVWGARGGSYSSLAVPGYGGYSRGIYTASNNQNLYIYTGGTGSYIVCGTGSISGGFNGGGSTKCDSSGKEIGSGGGATHISTSSGLLSSLVNNKSAVLIVAGGGTGTYITSSISLGNDGGAGGGVSGITGEKTNGNLNSWEAGGTQTAGGLNISWASTYCSGKSSFGQGANAASCTLGIGGGGGYYGGGAGWSDSAGGGGSGYIGGVDSFSTIDSVTIPGNQTMPSTTGGTEVGHNGSGYAKITLTQFYN